MKKLILFLNLSIIFSTLGAHACTTATIDSMIAPIDIYYQNRVAAQLDASLDTLGLCDENLSYAGAALAVKFDPYYPNAIGAMVAVISRQASSLPHELIAGLGAGLAKRVDLYYANSTYYMTNAIETLATYAPEYAKSFALALLSKQNPYNATANSYVLSTIKRLKTIAQPMQPPPPSPGPVVPTPIASPIWGFRSNNETCNGVTGPWGYYELCPRYYASVSDQFGNRIVLACKSENFGVDFRVQLSQANWSKIASTRVQTLAFGTSSTLQSLGVPYMISQASTLLAQEPVAPEILNQLRSSNSLIINVRSNSGEVNTRLNFSLKGSNAAINQLLQYCH
jgi:hypothetical protein